MSKQLYTARAAESGVLAAMLAKEGFTGAERILEGEKGFSVGLCPDPVPDAVTAQPDGAWELTRSSIKPWPCCRHTHPSIDAAIELHRKLDGAKPVKVAVGTYCAALDVCDRPAPEDPYSAKFSLQHCVAMALADGEVVQSSFDADARRRIAEARALVSLAVAPEIGTAYPNAWGTEITIETDDGRTLHASRREAKGDPKDPVSAGELSVKARALPTGGGMGEGRADALIAAILDLADDRPVREHGLFAESGAQPGTAEMARSA